MTPTPTVMTSSDSLLAKVDQTHSSIPTSGANLFEAIWAKAPRDLISAYAIRHESYLARGYITPQPHGLFLDEYDDYPNARTLLLFKLGKAAGTVRLNLFDPSDEAAADDIPSTAMFRDEIMALLKDVRTDGGIGRALEINRLARAPEFDDNDDLMFALYRTAGQMILHFDADVVFAAVRRHHVPFYRRIGFHKIADPRPYPHTLFETALMVTHVHGRKSHPIEIVSVRDDAYHGLIAGRRVPIFPARQARRPAFSFESVRKTVKSFAQSDRR